MPQATPRPPTPAAAASATTEPPRKKRGIGKWILAGIGVLIVVVVIASVASGGGNGGSSSSAPNGSSNSAAGIGDAVRDGKFEFTVSSVKCGVPKVGGQFGEKAQGQFCLVKMTVKNIGNESQTFDAGSQYAYDTAGNKLDADSVASLDANSGTQTFLEDINPGNQVTGVVVYDIPKAQHITKLELHDSPFSNGVIVTLTS